LGIEAYCWWRDDLDRRLDGNSSIKWSYPEILKATDLLQALMTGFLGEEEERRRSAIRAYMTAQYEDDQELKFKQTELRSSMTELFVDLPMRESAVELVDTDEVHLARNLHRTNATRLAYYPTGHSSHGDVYPNSAEYFINACTKGQLSRIVLEGAPGQGKSTVTQYICQVMRMKILGKDDELGHIPKQYKNTKVQLPFRVDLRDLAKWISGVDPFQSKPLELE
jgi:hypothetical protein